MIKPVSFAAPGKLLLAGEYAVLHRSARAVGFAVDRFVKTTVTYAPAEKLIIKSRYHEVQTNLQDLKNFETANDYVLETIKTVLKLSSEKKISVTGMNIQITTELEDETGTKYGLGSSAAVVVSLLGALNLMLNLKLSKIERLKLALLITWVVSPKTSGADIAISTLQSPTVYRQPDRIKVEEILVQNGLCACIEYSWPGLVAEQLLIPEDIALSVAWTKKPASTNQQVQKFLLSEQTHKTFLAASERSITRIIEASEMNDPLAFIAGIEEAKNNLLDLTDTENISYTTEELLLAQKIAEKNGAVFKISGAGGGDCGIAFTLKDTDATRIAREWELAGIVFLSVNPLTCEEIND